MLDVEHIRMLLCEQEHGHDRSMANKCTDINKLNNLNLAYRQESDKLDENVIFSKHCYPVTCFAQRYNQAIS